MSAHICNDNHYRAIARTLAIHYHSRRIDRLCDHWLKNDSYGCGFRTVECAVEWVNRIRKLNYDTFNAKYGENEKMSGKITGDQYKPLTNVQFSKALQCVQYQIEVEHIEQTEQVKRDCEILEMIINRLNAIIVQSLPEYDKAAWEIRDASTEYLFKYMENSTV